MKYLFLILTLFSFLLLSSQVKKTPRQIKIEEEIQKRVQQFRKSKQERCHQRVMDRAIEIVDSTLLIRAKINLSNGIERPIKPDKPAVKSPKDTLPVKPIF